MTLRSRLTVLYIVLLVGLQLVLGVTLYQVISATLLKDVDALLESTSRRVLAQINRSGGQAFSPEIFAPLVEELEAEHLNVALQLWGVQENLLWQWPAQIGRPTKPLSRYDLYQQHSRFNTVTLDGERLRVFSLYLRRGNEPFGVLQIGQSLAFLDRLRNAMLRILVVWNLVTTLGVGLLVWTATHRMLEPVEAVTQTALQITRADDLSRRIPRFGLPKHDEIGQLINAFNQTLERLEQLFWVQRRFLEDVSHELRTPLTVIKGNLALLRHVPAQDLESVDSIENEVDRLTRLVGDLLVLSRAESGNLPLTFQFMELDTLVLEVLSDLKMVAGERVQLRLGELDQVVLCADRDRLKQVLVNLVGNAIRYTPEGGSVEVGFGRTETQAYVRVRDTGPGIAPEDLPHIFERFYRAEKARTRSKDGHGFGLGLSIAYWIVHAHEGRIEVDSQPGEGTTFTVWLPLERPDCAT